MGVDPCDPQLRGLPVLGPSHLRGPLTLAVSSPSPSPSFSGSDHPPLRFIQWELWCLVPGVWRLEYGVLVFVLLMDRYVELEWEC